MTSLYNPILFVVWFTIVVLMFLFLCFANELQKKNHFQKWLFHNSQMAVSQGISGSNSIGSAGFVSNVLYPRGCPGSQTISGPDSLGNGTWETDHAILWDSDHLSPGKRPLGKWHLWNGLKPQIYLRLEEVEKGGGLSLGFRSTSEPLHKYYIYWFSSLGVLRFI